MLPFLLNLLGVDFGSHGREFNAADALRMDNGKVIDAMHYTLSGSFTHTILEWSAFCTAVFSVTLSFIYFYFRRDPVTPIIGVALFFAGCMDAFHTLASDRLIYGVADNQSLIPFTWVICRLFNALILIGGAAMFLNTKPERLNRGVGFIAIVSLFCSFVAYGIIYICAHSTNLPTTIFPESIMRRPWDVVPLFLFIVAGTIVFPKLYYKYPSFFSGALLVSVIPQIATQGFAGAISGDFLEQAQLHMVFGSTALFDNDFNIAHFLKIVAYLVPVSGLVLDYILLSLQFRRSAQKIGLDALS